VKTGRPPHTTSVVSVRFHEKGAKGGKNNQEMAYQFIDIGYPGCQLAEPKFSVMKRQSSGDRKAIKVIIQLKGIT
jgi:hypothetical protein